MQVSSLLQTAAVLVSLASTLGVATLAYADSLKASDGVAATASQPAAANDAQSGAMRQRGVASNTSPYDGLDFTVLEGNIYP
ncbi:MAG TPA: hypothetical protein VGP48_09720 [Stellaceae bacterium]|jgi:hypothetical protein|nr:hypothetical protein [Stellaceae bacterium]